MDIEKVYISKVDAYYTLKYDQWVTKYDYITRKNIEGMDSFVLTSSDLERAIVSIGRKK